MAVKNVKTGEGQESFCARRAAVDGAMAAAVRAHWLGHIWEEEISKYSMGEAAR